MSVNLKIPKKVEVGGLMYNIYYPYVFKSSPEKDDIVGLHTWSDCSIRINKHDNNQRLMLTLIHELLHAIDRVYTDYILSDNESLHDKLSSALYYVFSNNKIITNDKIPKYVDILGYKFTVKDRICFDECIGKYTGFGNLADMTIMLSGTIDSADIMLSYRKIELINTIIGIIQNIHKNSDEERKCIITYPLSQGIYQVFRNANIEELAHLSKRS